MDNQLLLYGVLAAVVLALWFTFKVVKKIVFVMLVVVVIVGMALGFYFNLF